MFDIQEFPSVYGGIAAYVRVSRDLQEIPGGLTSKVTPEDCCIYIASCVERLIQQGWEMANQEDPENMIRAIVGSKVSNISEADKFSERYTLDIMSILEVLKK